MRARAVFFLFEISVRVCFHARTCGIKVFVTEEQIAVGSGMDEFGCFNRAQARTRRVLFVQGWTFQVACVPSCIRAR